MNLNCTYLFKAQEGYRIELSFDSFQLEGAFPQCRSDYIVVRDGSSGESPLIGKFCGSNKPAPIISSENSLYFFFVSNEKDPFDGFSGSYRVIDEVEIAKCTQGKTIPPLFTRGYLTSPTFPGKYPPNRECSWTLQAPAGHFMTLVFRVFQTQCPDDKVVIRDGDQNGQLLGQFCGERELPVFRGRKLWVSFKSDGSFASAENGFNATFESLPFKGQITDHCTGGKDQIINASVPGTISSPWIPGLYPNNMDCTWKLQAPEGKRVNLKFDKFELAKPCGADFVEVSDVTADDTRSRGKYCGNFPDTTSAGEEVDVRFVSNSQGREKGFVIKYEAVNRGFQLASSIIGCFGLYAFSVLTQVYFRI